MDYRGLYDAIKRDPVALQREITAALRVQDSDLHFNMLRQAQIFGCWGAAFALSERDLRLQKAEVEETILPLARIQAEKQLLDTGRKVTVQAKDDVARSDAAYKIAQKGMIEQQCLTSVLKSTVEALRHKMNMMQSLNSRQKVELQALPTDWSPDGEQPLGPGYLPKTDQLEELDFLRKHYRAKRTAKEE